MQPALVDSIRQRMREQTTEHLLELWTTNDRVMWSAEAFEAIKSTLAERGHADLPPQNDPAPVALPYSPARDPDAQYWMGWLRPVLWISIAVGFTSLPRVASVFWLIASEGSDRLLQSFGVTEFWLDLVLGEVVLPALLAVGAWACLRGKARGRVLLLAYSVGAAANALLVFAIRQVQMLDYFSLAVPWMLNAVEEVLSLSRSVVLPLVLWWVLRRPEIRSIFEPSPRGFEPRGVSAK